MISLKKAAVATALVFVVTMGGVATANAAGGNGVCEASELCFFKDANYSGTVLRDPSITGAYNQNFGYGRNDELSSWKNQKSMYGRWYIHENNTGTCYNMVGNTQKSQVSPNDAASSWAWNGIC